LHPNDTIMSFASCFYGHAIGKRGGQRSKNAPNRTQDIPAACAPNKKDHAKSSVSEGKCANSSHLLATEDEMSAWPIRGA